jgi:hypothetical protein
MLIPSVVAESYITKMVLFVVILALIAWYIRRRRAGNKAFETEKHYSETDRSLAEG